MAAASLTINPTRSVFETLCLVRQHHSLRPLGAQLWLNGLGWSLCSRGPWVGGGGGLVRGAGKPGQAEGGPWEGAQGGLCCCKEAGGTVIGQLRGQV